MDNNNINGISEMRIMTEIEFTEFSKDMDELLKKHNCEIGIESNIKIMKRREKDIKSPYVEKFDGTDNTTEEEKKTN